MGWPAWVSRWLPLFLAATASGVTFNGQVVTASAPPASGCTAPPAATSFLTTQNSVYLYFVATVTSNDSLTDKWIDPTGQVAASGSWNAASGTFCFTGATVSIGGLSGAQLGNWSVQVFDNGTLLFSIPFTVSAGASPPTITQIGNAGNHVPPIAPNTWVEVFGSNLAPPGDIRIWQIPDFLNNSLPKNLDGVTVTVNGKSAYIEYISPTQLDILTPPDAMSGNVQLVVTNNGLSGSFTVQAQAVAPTFFQFNGGHVAAVHASGIPIAPVGTYPQSTPATTNETIELFGNGFGPTSTPVVSGALSQGGTLSPLPVVKIGGIAAQVTFAGLIGDGEYQINVVVPQLASSGDYSIVATYNGASTQAGLLLPVSATSLQITSGNGQTTPVNTAFATTLGVQLNDPRGSPINGATVTWTVTQGSATLSAGSSQTGSNGQTSVRATAGAAAGPIVVTAAFGTLQATFNLTSTSPNSGVPLITTLSSSAPAPLTPLYIQTTGVNPNSPVTVTFSNSSGYSVTMGAIRVDPSGMVVASVPIYANANATPSAGSVILTVSQGGKSSTPVNVSIQNLPTVQSYGVNRGDISRAFVNYEEIGIAQRLNELEAFQGLPGNRVDLSGPITQLKNMLQAVIESRNDLDRVTQNPSTVIRAGTLGGGTNLQFDANSLDMMDRVLGAYLTQMQPYLAAPPANAASARGGQQSPILGRSGYGSVYGKIVRVRHTRKRQMKAQAAAAETGTMAQLLHYLANTTNATGIAATWQSYAHSDKNFLDKISGVTGGLSGLLGLYAENVVNPVEAFPINAAAGVLGAVSGGAALLNDMGHELGALAFVITAGDNADPEVVQEAWQEAADANKKVVVDAVQTELGLISYGVNSADLPLFSKALDSFGIQFAADMQMSAESGALAGGLQMAGLAANISGYYLDHGFDTLENAVDQLSTEAAQGIIKVQDAFGELVGSVDLMTDLGPYGPLGGIQLNSDFLDTFDTLADPDGNYNLIVPIADPDFDYAFAEVDLVDPLTLTDLGSVPVNLGSLSSQSAFDVSTISGVCSDDDASDPDADDPDCD